MVALVPILTSIADLRRSPEVALTLGRTSLCKEIINEHRAMRDKTVVSDRHKLTNKRVGLNAAPFPDDDVALDLDKWPDKAVLADRAAIEVHRLDDRDPFAKGHIDDACLSDGRFNGCCLAQANSQKYRLFQDRNHVPRMESAGDRLFPFLMQSTKCSASARNGSVKLMFGNTMSPLR